MNGSNGSINGAVIDSIRRVYAKADKEGRGRPGRPTLVRLIRDQMDPLVTEHQVRQAKDQVDAEATSVPPAIASEAVLESTADVGPDERMSALADPGVQPRQPATNLVTTTPPAHQSAAKPPRPWPLVLIGLAAAVAVWSGWVGLGTMAGFGLIQPLPGIADGFTINSAVVLPISVGRPMRQCVATATMASALGVTTAGIMLSPVERPYDGRNPAAPRDPPTRTVGPPTSTIPQPPASGNVHPRTTKSAPTTNQTASAPATSIPRSAPSSTTGTPESTSTTVAEVTPLEETAIPIPPAASVSVDEPRPARGPGRPKVTDTCSETSAPTCPQVLVEGVAGG